MLFSQAGSSADILSLLHQPQAGKGIIKVNHSASIDNLLQKHISSSRKNNTIQGYRIRIFSDAGQQAREKANDARKKFSEAYPDITSYLTYQTPYFKVYVGDFRTKSEALKLYKQLQKSFPKAFIVTDKINPPKL